MKLFTTILSLFFIFTISQSKASIIKPFEIPRSNVIEIKDPDSDRVYPIFIKLPRSYNKNKERTYPVIYLTDALYTFQIVSGATRYPMNVKKMKEAIIVGISYSKSSKRDSSRVRDYTPSVNTSWKQKTGGAHQHMAFIEKSVIRYMEDNYRVNPSDRTFVGNSLGGLFGTYILLTKPELFNNYILGSPSYWFDDKFIFRLEKKITTKNINANVFIAIGERESKALESNYDMVKDAQAFYDKMLKWQQPNLKVKISVIAQANHQTAFPTTATQGLYWVYSK